MNFFLKMSLFQWVKNLSKSNETRYGVSPVYLASNTKRTFAVACPGKNWVFIRKFANFANNEFFKKGLFHRVKELSNPNQPRYGVPPST